MAQWIDMISSSSQDARATATTLSAAAADIFTGQDIFLPIRVTHFGARFTTAYGVAPTTNGVWTIQVVDKDDSTVTGKRTLTFSASSRAVGDIVYADLKNEGVDFVVTPGQRIRVRASTAAVMPGGSAAGAAVPMYAYETEQRALLTDSYSSMTKVTSGAA